MMYKKKFISGNIFKVAFILKMLHGGYSIKTNQFIGKNFVFVILLIFIGALFMVCLSNEGVADNPIVMNESPHNSSTYVSVYLSEIHFTVSYSGSEDIEYIVSSFPDFLDGVYTGVVSPGQTIHLLRRNTLLIENTTYLWWVNLTDGILWVNNTYSFTTGDEIFQGYTLFTPINVHNSLTYLINNAGEIVHTWPTNDTPSLGVYMVENGSIIRPCIMFLPQETPAIQKISWNGTVIWQFQYSNQSYWQTHDIAPLPNGNILILALERKTAEEAIDAGRNQSMLWDNEIWSVSVVEVHPSNLTDGEIVWEWHLWDHLIQDFNPRKSFYGSVGDHPELLDINFALNGYKDWIHPNTLHYNPELDQIIICSRNLGEFWIIDHSTTTSEAAAHLGGMYDHGGDFLYRWGNPQTYRAGKPIDQKLFGPHDPQWIAPGCPGEGNIIVFNNGWGRPEGLFSTIDEITPPVDAHGNYSRTPGAAYGPDTLTWQYKAGDPYSFYASFISGCERLPDGNTLICDGPLGYFFEVTMDGAVVWEHTNTNPTPESRVFRVRRYYSPFCPPISPHITGPVAGIAERQYEYSFLSIDPDNNPIYYEIDWGDNTTPTWFGPYSSGEGITLNHTWDAENVYMVRCRAKDPYDSLSNWSTQLLRIGVPYPPSNPSPLDGAADIDIHVNMSWIGGDPDPDDVLVYDIYFGTSNPPPKIISKQIKETFNPGVLQYSTTYYWKIVSLDTQGFSASSPIWNFSTIVDETAPTTIILLNGTLGENVWFITSVNVTLESTDTQSGVNYTFYKVDDDPWEIYEDSFVLSENGIHVLLFYSVDMVGNSEQIQMKVLRIDTETPYTTHVFTGAIGENSWYVSNLTITLSAIDNTSGVCSIVYQIDDENWSRYSTPLVITANGVHHLLYFAIDTAGNTESVQGPFDFKIDSVPPNISLTAIAQNVFQTTWLLIANVSDETSGIASVEFYVDDILQGTLVAPGPYAWCYEGNGKVAYAIGYDFAGNLRRSPHVNTFTVSLQSTDEYFFHYFSNYFQYL
jgi:fibronectin type 3 domain-containing protein